MAFLGLSSHSIPEIKKFKVVKFLNTSLEYVRQPFYLPMTFPMISTSS